MIPLGVVFSPPRGKGRTPIGGTIVADPAGSCYALVRCAFSLGENAGNTGSPRVEVWVALSETDFAPIIVRGSGWLGQPLIWSAFEGWHEVGEIRRKDVANAIRLASKVTETDAWLGPQGYPPTTIWDRRVLLPDDDRFPRSKYPLRASIVELLGKRNTCPDDRVWAIDAMIMNLSPRVD